LSNVLVYIPIAIVVPAITTSFRFFPKALPWDVVVPTVPSATLTLHLAETINIPTVKVVGAYSLVLTQERYLGSIICSPITIVVLPIAKFRTRTL
jgi:hypothetical protein